jgi:multiple sugar transport system permease protein
VADSTRQTKPTFQFGHVPRLRRKVEYPSLYYLVPLFILIIIVIYPLLFSLINSFRLYDFIHPEYGRPFIGFENYAEVLGDPEFRNSLWITLKYTVCTVLIELLIGLLLVALFSRITKGRSLFTAIILMPMIIAPSLAAIIFRWMYNSELGILNYLVTALGFDPIRWTGSGMALFSLMIIDVWQWSPFMFLIIFAGYLGLPEMPFEAAKVDGMTKLQELRHVTIPLLMPSILIAVLLRFIFAVQVFEYPFIITEGGPGVATETVNYTIYRILLFMNDVGKSAAGSFIFLVIVILLSQGIIFGIMRSEKWRS